ncbi:glutamate 5-kinase [Stakelama sediminis]|uniref:Glutamate 5-kinase n=1 Tax=Stakelama sediminis TaxID=463200 RepID=A0A840Z128_9SPHN|nr:glutamate 5-kinase [Stakelama sediminis]MBB5719444.1 glutamate 5-kinase [Stakelama sediminis]
MNEADRFSPERCPRLIIKVGSALLVGKDGEVRRDWLRTLAADIGERKRAGQEIVIVSSGSIAIGARRLGLPGGGRNSLEDAQASAARGQIALAQVWAGVLDEEALDAAQVLVTLGDLEDRRRYLNASATLNRLLSLDVIPIVNENDTVATERIRFGDNDRLAARVAQACGADGVILLSDVDGLYDKNPTHYDDAKLIPVVREIDGEIEDMADTRSASGMGSGGMVSKIEAARIATTVGADLAIVSGKAMNALQQFEQSGHGTVFIGEGTATARKAWLAGGLTDEGVIVIDQGAVKALEHGNSLLPAGCLRIEGEFTRGDMVSIVDSKHNKIARGLVEYDSDDAIQIVGRRSEDIPRILGYAPRSALVHRSHMAVL